jgi:hypothetical protein
MSFCVRHGSIEDIVGLSVRTRADITASFPSCASIDTCHFRSIYLFAHPQLFEIPSPRAPSPHLKDAILLRHSHLGAASGPHLLPSPYTLSSSSLPLAAVGLGVVALQSHRVQLAEPYVTQPSHNIRISGHLKDGGPGLQSHQLRRRADSRQSV